MTDALERLKKRQRPTVPTRDASLTPVPIQIPQSLDTSISQNLEQEIPTSPVVPNSPEPRTPAKQASQAVESADTLISRVQEAHTPETLDTSTQSTMELDAALQTKQSTLRLEQGVSDRLQTLARREGLCREVLIEAMFEYCEAHPEAMQTVIVESTAKNEHRQQIANLKRAKSMMQRFGHGG